MRLEYAIKFDDFRALLPRYTTVAGWNAGFIGALVACALIAALGVFCFVRVFGLPLADF